MSEKRLHPREGGELATVLRSIVHDELAETRSLRKNGHSWSQWLQKVITPERVLLVMVTIFTVGGKVQRYETDLEDANRQLQELRATVAKVMAATERTAAVTERTPPLIEQVDVRPEILTLQATIRRLEAQIAMGMTRQEFQAAMRQQILPRLERIERRIENP